MFSTIRWALNIPVKWIILKDFFFFLKVIEYVVPRFSDFQRMDQGAVAYPIKRQFHLIIYVFFYCNTLV